MSAAWAAVRFPDGEVRWTLYNVVDEVERELSGRLEPILEAWRGWNRVPDPVGPVYDVQIYSDYGGGFTWTGKATRNCLVEGWDAFADAPFPKQRGKPAWVDAALDREWEIRNSNGDESVRRSGG